MPQDNTSVQSPPCPQKQFQIWLKFWAVKNAVSIKCISHEPTFFQPMQNLSVTMQKPCITHCISHMIIKEWNTLALVITNLVVHRKTIKMYSLSHGTNLTILGGNIAKKIEQHPSREGWNCF